MTTVVIMPGGFHPFHAGHYALYQQARQAFPDAEVFVAATNDTSARPFPFAVKEKLAKLAGVEPGHFVQVKSPFRAEEITSKFDPNTDTLIFVRSEKDAQKPPQAGGVKRDGSPAYLQPYKGQKKLEPFSKHAYMAYLPTVEFGPGMTSATEIRTAWPTLNDRRKTALVMSLYPRTQSNPKLAATVRKMLDTAIVSLEEAFPVQPVAPVVPKLPTQQQPKQHTHTLPDNKKKTTPAAVIHIKEFAPGDGSGDEDPSFNPETFYDIPKLKAVAKRLAQRSVNHGWYDLQLKVLIRYMSEPYIITLDDLEEMFPTAPEIVYYIERNIIKAWPSNEPPYIIKNPNYKPRAPKTFEDTNKLGYHTRVQKGKFLPSKYGEDQYNYLHDLMNSSGDGSGPMLVTVDDKKIAREIAAMYGGDVEQTGLGTYRIVQRRGSTQQTKAPELTDVAEGDVVPFRRPSAQLTWQQLPKDVLQLANDWYWASEDDSGLAAVLDPKGFGSGTRNELQYITAKLQQRGWSIDFNDEHDPPGEFNLILKNKNGQSLLLSIEDAQDFTGWAQGTNPVSEDSDYIEEKWSEKYKRGINCSNPKGFSQRAHCAGRKK